MCFHAMLRAAGVGTPWFTTVGRGAGLRGLHVQISFQTSVRAVGVLTRKFTTVG
jgi:hypothetical protein